MSWLPAAYPTNWLRDASLQSEQTNKKVFTDLRELTLAQL
jgi:hypothetical protein